MWNSRSKRPGRLKALSTADARFVAPRIKTRILLELIFSSSVCRPRTPSPTSSSNFLLPPSTAAESTESNDTSSALIFSFTSVCSSCSSCSFFCFLFKFPSPIPSINASIVATIRASTSPAHSRFGQSPSSSSINRITGERLAASIKDCRNRRSVSPTMPLKASPPLMIISGTFILLAKAVARRVLPVPGGPSSSAPRGGFSPFDVKRSG